MVPQETGGSLLSPIITLTPSPIIAHANQEVG